MDALECEYALVDMVPSPHPEHETCDLGPVIVTLKTSIENIHDNEKNLLSLFRQTYTYKKFDKVLLNVVVSRDNTEKEECSFIKSLREEFSDTVVVNYVNYNWGIITGIVEALKFIDNKNTEFCSSSRTCAYPNDTRLIYCEDYINYPDTMIEILNLLSLLDSGNSVWGATGFNVCNMNVQMKKLHGCYVEVLEAYGGVVTRVGNLIEDFIQHIHSISDENILVIRDCADIIISNYFAKHNVSKKIINLENKNYSFDYIWSNMRTCNDNTILSRNMVWENYMDSIYVLSGWKELYLKLS